MSQLLTNYYEAASVILFGIGFMNLLLQRNLIKKFIGLNIMDTATYLFLAAKGYVAGRTAPILTNGVNRASTYISLPCKWDIQATIFIPADFQRLLYGAAFFMPWHLSAARSAFRFHAAGFRMPGPPPLLSLPRFPSCVERQAKAAF